MPSDAIPLNAHLAGTGIAMVFLGIQTGWRGRNYAEKGLNDTS